METVDVRYIGSNGQYQTYSPQDTALINTALITANFGGPQDYIEYFVKDLQGQVVGGTYFTTQYDIGSLVDPVTGTTQQIILDPERDIKLLGFDRGIVNVKYNFFTRQLESAPELSQNFWIQEISPSRTEIKTARQDLSNTALANAFGVFNGILSADAYYPTFYLNFGDDVQVIGVNAVYVEEDGVGYIIFKLYEPLPIQFDLKSTFWVVTPVADPAEFNVTINVTAETVLDTTGIRGPNFKVSVTDTIGQTTPYYNYEDLFATVVTSSLQQISNFLNEKAIQINVDYSDFANFIHFSSATERLYNFVYKLQQIETASLGLQQTNTTQAKITLQSQIDSTIKNFDNWEYYLYFGSGSASWPKQTDRTPYILYSVTSSQAVNWLGSPTTDPSPGVMSMYWSSSYYDNNNKDWLVYTAPQYILDDSANAPYIKFLDMIGQHFDNIWIYLKDLSNRYDANNNPFVGISMDQVSEAIQSFGVKLYTNTSISDNIFYSLFGINQTGSNLPVTSSQYARLVFPSSSLYAPASSSYLSSSLFLPPVGEEKINRYVVTIPYAINNSMGLWNAPSSLYGITTWGGGFISLGYVTPSLPGTQIEDEIYKRIYHNLPYLLKTRGTERGMRALIATYGVPSNILEPLEFGGYNYLEYPGIQEISQVRIITGSVTQISSSLLSPNTTIQYYNNDFEKTSITVQAGFSPADSINASITSSGYVTSSTQPGYFNIMQYIGAPNLQYSSSYIPLVELGDTYFSNEYTNGYNVWDFIRLTKYYNNSLFKMLRDWVPARASADTGIVIKSHMLERNKYPRHEPTATTSSFDADYYLLTVSGSDGGAVIDNTNFVAGIPIQYNGTASIALTASIGTVFVSSSNDIQKYTGEFSGSYIQVTTNYFPQEEISSYIFPWTSSTPGNNGLFLTYSVSPLFENVFTPVRSQRFLDLDYNSTQLAPVNYGLITKSLQDTLLYGNITQSLQPYSQYAYVQDYNYSSRPYIIPRYSGSYLSGQYNTSSAGDISYGNEPVINYYTNKLGLFTQIATSSFFPGKVNVNLAYLADVSGGLFELNQNNRNWIDVQNIFVAGTTATIKQFDNRKFGNQVSTDGIKALYNSGYNYTPQLYFSGSGKLYFEYVGGVSLSTFNGISTGTPNAFISGAASPNYAVTLTNSVIRAGNIYNIFDSENPASTDFSPGTSTNWASFTASVAGQRTFTIKAGINIQFENPATTTIQSASFTWGAYITGSSGASLIGTLQTQSFTSVNQPAGYTTGSIYTLSTTEDTTATISIDQIHPTVYGPFDLYINGTLSTSNIGNSSTALVAATVTTATGTYYMPLTFDAPLIPYLQPVYSPTTTILNDLPVGSQALPAILISGSTLNFNYTTPAINLPPNSKVVFEFKQAGVSTSNYTASLVTAGSNNSLTTTPISVGQGGYPFAQATIPAPFITDIADFTDQTSVITLSSNLTQYLNYQFVPYFVSASVVYSSSLYDNYGDINVPFSPQFGDKVVMYDNNGIYQDLDIVSSSISGSQLQIIVSPQVIDNWVGSPNIIGPFLLLRKYKDEQNAILTFNKTPGATSYGFLIPDTISPEVVENINTLQAAVQSQLLNTQSPLPGGI